MKKIFLISLFFLLIFIGSVSAQDLGVITTQGILRDPDTNGALPDGTYQLTFRIYDQEMGGAALWVENHGSVQLKNSMFNVELGSINSLSSLAFDTQYWLGIGINGGTELTPRNMLTASSYAMSMIGTDNQLPSSGVVTVGGGHLLITGSGKGVTFADDTRLTSADIDINSLIRDGGTGDPDVYVDNAGKVGIGTTSPTRDLHVIGDAKINGDLDVGGDTLYVANNLNITDALLVNGKRPIRIERYEFNNNDNNVSLVDTNYLYDEWVAVIVGFDAGHCDYNSQNNGHVLQVEVIPFYHNPLVFPPPLGGKTWWIIEGKIRADDDDQADWDIEVMYIRRNLASEEE